MANEFQASPRSVDTGGESEFFSYSEIHDFTRCRQKWFWGWNLNLEEKGVKRAKDVGSCGHVAIAAWAAGMDWQQAVDRWFLDQVDGRELFDEEVQELQDMAVLVKSVMPRYIDHYKDDGLQHMLVEHPFQIPIKAISKTFRGIIDAIVRGQDGNLWMVERKWVGSFRPPEYTDMDTQIGIYQWAAIRIGIPIVGTIYDQILTRTPAVPQMNQNRTGKKGAWVSRAKILTTWEDYSRFLQEVGEDPEDYIDDMLPKLSGVKFFDRHYIRRSQKEIANFADQLERRVWEMQKTRKHIYMNESYVNCRSCDFRRLCLETLKGGDVQFLVENAYQQKASREEAYSGSAYSNSGGIDGDGQPD